MIVGSVCNTFNFVNRMPLEQINFILLTNAIYDEMYITHIAADGSNDRKFVEGKTHIPNSWDFETVAHAKFSGNLHAGNVNYYAEEVDSMRIKRRHKSSYEWQVLFDIPINNSKDFRFEVFDRYARSNADYEYCLVPVIHGIEGGDDKIGNVVVTEVCSEFDELFLIEKEDGYHTGFNINSQLEKNHPTIVVQTLGRKHPYVFGNGQANYYSGSLSAVWVELDRANGACHFDFENSWKYRHRLMEFLCNGNPKMLKMPDGRMWLVAIVNTPTETAELHELAPTIEFNWVEIANGDKGAALYENGLIDTDANPR